MGSWPAFVVQAVLHAGLFFAAARAGAQAILDCGQGCAPRALTCGGQFTGDLSPADCKEGGRFVDIWTWDATSPFEAEVRIEAVGFTPRLLLLVKPEGFPCITIAESAACESPAPGAACLRARVFGNTILAVTSDKAGETGSYMISASCGTFRCDPACRRGSIACGGTVSGNLTPGTGCTPLAGGAFDSWDFDVAGLTRVQIAATSASALFASIHYPDFFGGHNCLELAAPRRCAPGSCIDLVLEPGAVHISIAAASPGGTYDMSVSCVEFDPCTACPIAGSVGCGSQVSGSLGPEDCEIAGTGEEGGYRVRRERWTLDVARAGLYKVSVDAPDGSVSAGVVLRDGCVPPDVPFDFCPGPAAADSCSVSSLEPGAYFVVVSTIAPGEPPPIDYSLSVACVDLGPCRDCVRGELACGSQAAGRLAPAPGCGSAGGAPLDVWSFTFVGPPSDLTFTTRSSAFAPRVIVLDSLCGTVASSDRCPDSPGAACTTVLSSGSTIFVGVTSDSPQAAGDYEIEVVCEEFSACAPRCSAGVLGEGFSTGDLTADDCAADPSTRLDAWTYTAASPGTYEVLVEAAGFTPRVEVLDASCGSIFIEGGAPGEFGRGVFDLDAGAYRIVVRNDFTSPGALGQYRLRVRPFADCDACGPAGAAECREEGVLSGTFGPGDCRDADGFFYEAYDLDVSTAREIQLASRPGVDVFLWLFEEECRRRLSFLSGGFGLATLLEAGKYRVLVSSFAPDTPGSWSVFFSCKETAFCNPACIVGTIACGQTAAGELTNEDCSFFATVLDVWRLDVPPGGASIQVRQGAAGPLAFGAFPAACDALAPLDQLCEQDASGAYFCDLAPGSYLLHVSTSRNVVIQQGVQPYTIEAVTSACGRYGDQLPGDCNQDGKLDLADGICLLSHLFQGEPSVLSCEAGGLGLAGRSLLDWNGDRVLNLTDPVALLVHLFQSGVPHVLGSECVPGSGCPRACGG